MDVLITFHTHISPTVLVLGLVEILKRKKDLCKSLGSTEVKQFWEHETVQSPSAWAEVSRQLVQKCMRDVSGTSDQASFHAPSSVQEVILQSAGGCLWDEAHLACRAVTFWCWVCTFTWLHCLVCFSSVQNPLALCTSFY